MPIYHLTVKVISRGKGQSVVAASAYRAGQKLFDERLGKYHNYQKKSHVVHREILVPADAPTWITDISNLQQTNDATARERLWNCVEARELLDNAQLAREVEFALPLELNREQGIALAREFIFDQFVKLGMVADWAVHWEENNPHVHVLLTMRSLNKDGFGTKVREWNNKAYLQTWREQWAAYTNFHLKLHQHNVHIDHRSYDAQGIDLIPTQHLGKAVIDMDARGIKTDVMHEAKEIHAENWARILAKPTRLLKKISAEVSTFANEHIVKAVHRYLGAATQQWLSPEISEAVVQQLEQHQSVFSERDLAKMLFPYHGNAESFAHALTQLKQSPLFIHLGAGDDGRERYTTHTMLKLEKQLQRLADKLHRRGHVVSSLNNVEKTLTRYETQNQKTLTEEQRHAVIHLTCGRAIACLIGRAGTGKSFSLGAAKALWEKKGFRVQGIALSGIAADGLQQSAGIPSRTIDSWLHSLEKDTLQLTPRDVIVMDEASMTDSHLMRDVLNAVQKASAKLVLVGDPAQLQPVGAGASFRALVERIGFAELQTVYRQEEVWQREATTAFSTGDVKTALQRYHENNCIHFASNDKVAMQQLICDWQKLIATERLILAHRNQDVNALNKFARDVRIQAGEICTGYSVHTYKGEILLSEQDRILFLKNDTALGVSNGRFATVTHIDKTESGKVLRITAKLDGEERNIIFSPNNYSHFTHGYAATVHKSQGVTIDHALVFAGGRGWNRHVAYVAMTRHRESCRLYVDKILHPNLNALEKHLCRRDTKESVLDFPHAFARRRGLADTSPLMQRRQDARLVAQYIDAHRAVCKAMQTFTNDASHEKTLALQAACKRRDTLAAQIFREQTRYAAALTLHDVFLEKLSKHAGMERKLLFEQCSPDEKHLLRLAYRYQKIHRNVGRTWAKLFASKQPMPSEKLHQAERLTAKRNYLAYQLLEQLDTLEWQQMFNDKKIDKLNEVLHQRVRIDIEKVHQHATSHTKRVDLIREWQEATLDKTMMPHEVKKLSTTIDKRLPHYIYALQATGETEATFRKKIALQSKVKSIDIDAQKRIEKARAIEATTQSIQGTLAERYLREHRGIKTELPESLRFHPSLYHFQAKKKLPALVAVAHNAKGHTTAVQVIYLDEKTANKASVENAKLTYGLLSTKHMGVLIHRGKTNQTVPVAEGIETALSVKEANPDITIYAVLGSSNFSRAPISSEAKTVLFCADNDGANANSQKLLAKAAKKIVSQGITVLQAIPENAKEDFNDVLKTQGVETVKNYLDNAKALQTSQEKHSHEQHHWREAIKKIVALEKDMQAAEQQPYAFLRTAAREAFEKYAMEVVKDKSLFQIIQWEIPHVGKEITKVVQQEHNIHK